APLVPPAGGSLLADLDAREATNRGIAAQPRYERPNRRLLVLDERLLDERTAGVGLVEPVDLAVDDLGPGLLGLALLAGLRLVDLALVLDDVGRHVVARNPARCGARDVQRDVVRDFARPRRRRVDATELDQHADRAALVLHVLVRVEQAVGGLHADDSADLDLLAERAGEALHEVVD